jgi:opacity protein-like surface antigen
MRPAIPALAVLCLALPVAGGTSDLFGGYSFEHSSSANDDSLSRHGWNASFAIGVAGPLALVADASGHYGTSGGVARDQLTLMGGPRVSFVREGKASPFVHALFGRARERAGVQVLDLTISNDEKRFGMLFGGGLDVRVSGRWAVRLEGDYQRSSKDGGSRSGVRACVGAVYRFGRFPKAAHSAPATSP